MKQRYVRAGELLDDDDEIVVRGGELDPAIVSRDAERMFKIYGLYGISVFSLPGATIDELGQQTPFVRFPLLTLISVGAIRRAGLHLEATGRNPRHYTVVLPTSTEASPRCRCATGASGTTRTMNAGATTRFGGPGMELDIDITADLSAQDDDGLGWSILADAHDPGRVKPGVMLLAGNGGGTAVVRIVAVDDDGQVHFTILPGSVEKNRHLLGRTIS